MYPDGRGDRGVQQVSIPAHLERLEGMHAPADASISSPPSLPRFTINRASPKFSA